MLETRSGISICKNSGIAYAPIWAKEKPLSAAGNMVNLRTKHIVINQILAELIAVTLIAGAAYIGVSTKNNTDTENKH